MTPRVEQEQARLATSAPAELNANRTEAMAPRPSGTRRSRVADKLAVSALLAVVCAGTTHQAVEHFDPVQHVVSWASGELLQNTIGKIV